MWPLLLCSLVSLTISIERMIFWWRHGWRQCVQILDRVFDLVEAGDYDGAIEAGKSGKDSMSMRVLLAGLKHRKHGLTEAMQIAGENEIEKTKQGLSILDTIVTMAPLLGILGTVTGIIKSFDLLGVSLVDNPKAVVGGIAEALITTAAGLVIALVTLIPLNYFMNRSAETARKLEQLATQFEVACKKGREGR